MFVEVVDFHGLVVLILSSEKLSLTCVKTEIIKTCRLW